MNLSGFSPETLGGKLLRLPLRLIPASARLPIIRGPSRGRRWIVGSGNHGCWLGSYEHQQRSVFERYVGVGDVVFDVGAHVGFYTLVASALVGPHGQVVAFEPLPENLYFLREHLSINNIDNVTVIDKAVTDHTGFVRFRAHENRSMGGISDDGDMNVAVVCLDELIESSELPPPSCIKMDVEGEEYRALTGAKNYLSRSHPVIFLSTHGPNVHSDCCRLLKQFNYDLIPLDGKDIGSSSSILAIDGT